MEQKLDRAIQLLEEIRGETNMCCMSHMDPDYILERLDIIEELLTNEES